jgi:hypothetical protein
MFYCNFIIYPIFSEGNSAKSEAPTKISMKICQSYDLDIIVGAK